MKTFARIQDGVVVELLDAESIEGRFHPSLTWVEVTVDVAAGWLFDGEVFYAPPAPLAVDWREPVIEAFKLEREKLLNRMMSIAGRVARAGDTAFALALDAMAEAIIPLDTHPLVVAATDADSMREAFVLAYREVALAALTSAPDQETALAWKTEIDKVFK